MPNEKIAELGAALKNNFANWQTVLVEHEWLSIINTGDDLIELLRAIGQSGNESVIVALLKKANDIELTSSVLFDHQMIKLIKQPKNVLWIIKEFPGMLQPILFSYEKIRFIEQIDMVLGVIAKYPEMAHRILFEYRRLEVFKDETALWLLFDTLYHVDQSALIEGVLFGANPKFDLITNVSHIASLITAIPQRAEEILFFHKKLRLFNTDELKMDLLLRVSFLPEQDSLSDLLRCFFIPRSFTEEMSFLEKHRQLLSEFMPEFMLCRGEDFITNVHELCTFVRCFPSAAHLVLFGHDKISLLSTSLELERLCSIIRETKTGVVGEADLRVHCADMRSSQSGFFVSLANKANAVIEPPKGREKMPAVNVGDENVSDLLEVSP